MENRIKEDYKKEFLEMFYCEDFENIYKEIQKWYEDFKGKIIYLHYEQSYYFIVEEEALDNFTDSLSKLLYLRLYRDTLKELGENVDDSYWVSWNDLIQLSITEIFEKYNIKHKDDTKYLLCFVDE